MREAGREAHGFAQRVERVDLIVDDAADLQMKTVGAEVDRGEGVVMHGLSGFKLRPIPLVYPRTREAASDKKEVRLDASASSNGNAGIRHWCARSEPEGSGV